MNILYKVMTVLIWLLLFTQGASGQDTIRLENYQANLKKMKVTINGQPYTFLFDTGGGETLMSPDIAKSLNKAIYGNSTGYRMNGDRLDYGKCDSVSISLGPVSIFHPTIGIWDIMKILPEGVPKIDGVISLKSFKDKVITLDLASDLLILENCSSYRRLRRQMVQLNSRFATGQDGNELNFFFAVPFRGRLYWFLFDSANIGGMLLSHSTANAWGLQDQQVKQPNDLGVVSVCFGNAIGRSEAVSAEIIYDGCMNYEILSQYVFMMDLKKMKIWMK